MKRFNRLIFGVSYLLFFLCNFTTAQTVWPGDVNNNGKVTAVDVLYAGVAYGNSGEPRQNATIDWVGQDLTMPWFLDFASGVNYGFADADGDGFVGDNDIFGTIKKNYELTNAPVGSDGYELGTPNIDPSLVFHPVFDTVAYGAYAEFEIELGDQNIPVSEFYGISFQISYDAGIVASSNAINFSLDSDAWVDPTDGQNSRVFVSESDQPGRSEIAITRINQNSIPLGAGKLGSFFILIEDVGSFLPANDTLIITIDSVKLIKNTNLETQPVAASFAMVVVSNNSMNNPTSNCPDVVSPVCGSNGVTYLNSCYAEADGIFVYTPGVCYSDCIEPTQMFSNATCPTMYDPVCGCNGITYINDCFAESAGVKVWTVGKCPTPDQSCYDPQNVVNGGYTDVDPDTGIITQNCPDNATPVCGCDGITYSSACLAEASGITFYTAGDCGTCVDPAQMNPDTLCAYNYDPVCGCNHVTYMNECLAQSAGVTSYTAGPCLGTSLWCESATPIQCGDFLPFETTVGEINKISNYPNCLNTTLVGPDKVYVLHKTTPGDLQIGLEIMTPGLDLDIFLLKDNCSQVECIESSHTSNSVTNNEGILYEDAPIGTYYIVVDGQFDTSVGNFRLEVSCGYLDCYGAEQLECDVPYLGTNINGNDDVSLYKCGNIINVENNGPEKVHTFTITEPGEVDITLTDLSANLELFLLKKCDANSCLKFSQNSGNSSEYINIWLAAGTYYVVVDGYNGAVSDYSLTVACSSGCDFDLNLSSTDASCGNSDGSITATSQGGNSPFWVSWNGPVSGSFTTYSNSCTIYNLPSGTYWITKTDANGCSITKEVTINDSGNLNATITPIHATCATMGMGKLNVQINSGQGPYHVILSGPSNKNIYTSNTNFTLNNLNPGNYTIYIVDSNGCGYSQNLTINNTNGLNFTVNVNNASCGQTGSMTVNLGNGTAPFWVIIAGPVTNSFFTYNNQITIPNLPGGVYQVIVEDANWCQGNQQVIIQSNVLDVNAYVNNGVCGQKGSINLFVNNGTAPYQISWSGPVSGNTTIFNSNYQISNLPSGTYSINTTDANGCSDYQLVTVDNSADELDIVVTAGNGQCGNTGFIWIDAYNGTAPYTLVWNGPSSGTAVSPTPGMDITNLESGCYFVEVTDANGCSATESICIQNEPALEFEAWPNNGNCGQNGSVAISIFSGTPTYFITWTGPTSGNATTNASTYQINNLQDGNYSIYITDGAGCSNTEYITINNSGNMTLVATANPSNCGPLGSIQVNVDGGNSPYSISWSGPVFGSTNSNSGNYTIPNLPSGTYTISAWDSGNCYETKTVLLTNGGSGISVTATPNNSNCAPYGSILVHTTSTAFPITISWSGPSSGVTTVSNNNYTIPNLPSGTYTINVVDSEGCTDADNAVLNNGNGISLNTFPQNGVCGQNGSIDVEIWGGAVPIVLNWTGASSGSVTIFTTTYSIPNLPSGNYSITATDINGCSDSNNTSIQNSGAVNLNTFPNSGVCGQNGSIQVEIWSGVVPILVEWAGPVSGSTTINTNNYNIQNLPSGVYTIKVTDATGCQETEGVSLTNGSVFSLNTNANPGICGQYGSIDIEIWGGNAPNTISWNGPVSGSATTNQNVYNIANLPTGNYSITVIDADGCEKTKTVYLDNGTTFTLNTTLNNGTCGSNGSIDIELWGASSPSQVIWSGPVSGSTTINTNLYTINNLPTGNYTISVIDNQGCSNSKTVFLDNGSAPIISAVGNNGICGAYGSISLDISNAALPIAINWSGTITGAITVNSNIYDIQNLPSGTYNISIVDNNGCSANKTVTLNNGNNVGVTAIATPGNCGQNGSISVDIIGATGLKVITWTGPVSGTQTINNLSYTIPNLPSGSYSISITDSNGCTASQGVTLTNGTNLSFSANSNNGNCGQTGSINLSISNGSVPFSINWIGPSNGTITINTTNFTIPDLQNGTYSITIIDSGGCSSTSNVPVVVTDAPVASVTSSNILCDNAADGSASASVSGGTQPFTYIWSNGQTTQTISNLGVGNYFVTVTDANNCTSVASASIIATDPVTIDVITTNVLCAGDNTGSIEVTGWGGTPNFTYEWSDGTTFTEPSPNLGSTLSNLFADNYGVTVTDMNGCTTSAVFTVEEPQPLTIGTSVVNANCNSATGSATATPNGGTGPYTYTWSNGSTDPTISNVMPGTYDVTVLDTYFCSETATVTIGSDGQAPTAQFSTTNDLLTIDFYNNSTGNPVSFVWDFGDGTTSTNQNPTYEYCEPGTYDVCLTVTNACGVNTYCQSVIVSIPASTVILDVGESMGTSGSTIAVPVYIENLSNLVSLAGSLQLSDPFVGTITGVTPGAIAPTFGGANNTFSFFEATGHGVDLNNGDILFYVAVNLIGNPGDEAELIIWDTPLDVEVGGKINGVPTILDHIELKGKVMIPHTATMSGTIYTFEDEAVAKANVNVFNQQFSSNFITNSDGNYLINNIPMGMEYIIEPTKDTFPDNGLSTFSLFVGQQFILGMNPPSIWSPFQVIAGDANCNGSFTTFDLFLIQQIILGTTDKFTDCQSWVFVPEHHNFQVPFDAYNVFPFPTADTMVIVSDTAANFIGVKKGDILGFADPQNLNDPSTDDRDDNFLQLVTQNLDVQEGETFELTFTSNNFDEIAAIQMAITLNADKLQYEEFTGLALNSAAVGNPNDGELRLSWFDLNGTSVTLDSTTALFSIKFKALEKINAISDVIEIGATNFKTEAHSLNGDVLDIELIFEDPITSIDEDLLSDFYLYQNVPNPFENYSVIQFELPNRMNVELTIQNAIGETVEVIRGEYNGGLNQVKWEQPNLSSGIYFYTLKSGNYHMTRKMIKL